MKILNLTGSELTPEQELGGAVALSEECQRNRIGDLVAFEEPPSRAVLLWRAAEIVRLLREWKYIPVVAAALIGGPPYFTPYLAAALRRQGLTPLHAFRPVREGQKAAFVEAPSQYDVSFSRH
ncbi:MAG: hypothetical protein OXN97_11680 [Bryobacterales bacterium]|nr:hypothetical protein [Bryobacterales bacterium]